MCDSTAVQFAYAEGHAGSHEGARLSEEPSQKRPEPAVYCLVRLVCDKLGAPLVGEAYMLCGAAELRQGRTTR